MTVGIAAVANFIIGALWYGPLFGKTWMRLSGITMESMKGMSMTPVKAMTLGFIGTLLLSLVLAHMAAAFEAAGAAGALELAFWIWLGFFLPVVAGGYLWEGKPLKLFLFNATHQFIALSVTALILVLWR